MVCELANMICGSVLSRVESSTTFRLATPRILAFERGSPGDAGAKPELGGPPPSAAGDRSPAVHAVGIGSGRMVVIINQEIPAWPAAARYAF